jgi:two-component system, OmpR family, response regulator
MSAVCALHWGRIHRFHLVPISLCSRTNSRPGGRSTFVCDADLNQFIQPVTPHTCVHSAKPLSDAIYSGAHQQSNGPPDFTRIAHRYRYRYRYRTDFALLSWREAESTACLPVNAVLKGAPPLNTPLHIAVVDDEKDITTLLTGYLSGRGFRVTALQSGRALMDLMHKDPPALVLLDLGLPGEDGFVIARQLREHWRCGLVIVTGRGDAVDKVVGLEVGADDYVTKPFDMRELLARIKAVLRRLTQADALSPAAFSQTPATEPLSAAVAASLGKAEQLNFLGWQLNTAARSLTDSAGADVALTSGEFSLLCAFVRHPGRVLSRDFLMEQTHGREAGPFDRTVDVQVGRLRKKLEVAVDDPQIIKSVRSAGYIFVPAVTSFG